MAQTIHLLIRESRVGTMGVSFGRNTPEARIYFSSGTIVASVFGDLTGAAVFDLLICQEYSIKEIKFVSGDIQIPTDLDSFTENPLTVFDNVRRDVDQCAARPLIYGLIPVRVYEVGDTKDVEQLLLVMHNFNHYSEFLRSVTPSSNDKDAPLSQCRLLHRALSRNVIQYKTPLVALKSFHPLLELVQPLEQRDAENLQGYLRSLLHHPRATHMPLERFFAFASAVEAIAYRRGEECGEACRNIIYMMIQETTNSDDDDLSPPHVAEREPTRGSDSSRAMPRAKPKNNAQPADDRSWRQVIRDGLSQHYKREQED